MFVMTCPICDNEIRLKRAYEGDQVLCYQCKSTLTIEKNSKGKYFLVEEFNAENDFNSFDDVDLVEDDIETDSYKEIDDNDTDSPLSWDEEFDSDFDDFDDEFNVEFDSDENDFDDDEIDYDVEWEDN